LPAQHRRERRPRWVSLHDGARAALHR
jgi:hypothetical protein